MNLRRCARARILDAGESTNTTLALTNNSASSELILVWQLLTDGMDSGVFQCSYQQIAPFVTNGVVQAIVPGDAPPPGLLTSGDWPTVFPADWSPPNSADGTYWPATFPFAVLQPAWSLVMQVSGGGTAPLSANIFWEAILPKYFDRFYNHQLLEIELALKG